MKTKPILITLSLLTATSLLCSQEVYANELESKPVVHNNLSSDNNDWFDDEGDVVDKPSIADDKPINEEVSDLFAEEPAPASEEGAKPEKVISSNQENPEALEDEISDQNQSSPTEDKPSKASQEGPKVEKELVREEKQPTSESPALDSQKESLSPKAPKKAPIVNLEAL
ncbi:hypothetical protein A9Y57_01498 [Streptococcus parauberis]|uniref:Uncharacterized protein n=1 Tax=Streptococcus parauberis TaxID=1348 RepID=A0A854WEM3_9STRE|nr:hypothetical protein [Streptococcus parauberis]PCH12779.1 hypothetical protein A9Y57_01498 [Streptococcus parauberis]